MSHVRPHSFISFSTVPLHVSFGRPRLLLPSAVQRKAVLSSAPCDIRHTCPSHLCLRLLICVVRDVACVLRSSSSLVMVLGQNTPRIFRRHLFYVPAWLSVSSTRSRREVHLERYCCFISRPVVISTFRQAHLGGYIIYLPAPSRSSRTKYAGLFQRDTHKSLAYLGWGEGHSEAPL